MKSNNRNRKADYSKVKQKLYSYLVIALLVAVAIVILLRVFIQQQQFLGNWIVSFLENLFYLSRSEALTVYQYSIRNNMEIIIFIAVAVCFLLLCRILLSKFMKYFDEINAGIDSLMEGDDRPIEMSPEISFIDQKLNTLKQTLEKRTFEAQLAEQRKNDLVMYLAHDIKTPLTSIIGYLNLLEEAPDMPAKQKAKYVHITLEKSYRLDKMIDEFFDITRFNLQKITLNKEKIDLYFMLVQICDELTPILSTNQNTIQIRAEENLTIDGDPDKLARVFNNVLKNAAAYSYRDTGIAITVKEENNFIIISTQNRGKTIPKERLDTIFEKFYRLDQARTSNTGGAGLGLAIAKEIVTLHGGEINAHSENDTITFVITLPKTSLNN